MIEVSPNVSGFDIIGDIHGCYEPLQALLQRLGYQSQKGIYRHPDRQAIFVGDLIDRGPGIRETLALVRAMVEAGAAVMVIGNHEYNALRARDTLHIALSSGKDDPRLLHHSRLLKLMAETVEQFSGHLAEWESHLNWFGRLPLFLQGPGFRVVHACWDEVLITEFLSRYGTNCLSPVLLDAARSRDSWEHHIIDRLTRGTLLPLPEGMQITGRDGFVRRFFRAKFWSQDPQLYSDVVFQPDPLPGEIKNRPLDQSDRDALVHYSPYDAPVFFGHYWLKGLPQPLQHNIACLDYSAVHSGRLTAYRFDGERQLNPEKFVWVSVDS